MRIAVLGAGAIGSLYGARLARAGHDVVWVVRPDTARQLRRGLTIDSVDGNLQIDHPEVVTDPADAIPAEVVMVAVKTTANDRLAQLVGPLAGPDTLVTMFQNGWGNELAARSALGPGPMLAGALCFVCAQRDRPGHIRHLDYGAVTLGAHQDHRRAPSEVDEAVRGFAATLAQAGVGCVVAEDLASSRWRKLVWNVGFNGLSVVLDAGTDELISDPHAVPLVRMLMDEVVHAAAATGSPIPATTPDEMLTLTHSMTPYLPSMRLDWMAGRPMEIDAIYGAPRHAAARVGLRLPTIGAVEAQLRFLEGQALTGRRG